ncbi:V-type ATP synthase subunit D [Lacunimicrobium album]
MALALNKSALKHQRDQLGLFRKFLPSLDLKRQQLLGALKAARLELEDARSQHAVIEPQLNELYPLLGSDTLATRDLTQLIRIEHVDIGSENLAGVHLPRLGVVQVSVNQYSMLSTPHWVDNLVHLLKQSAELQLRLRVMQVRVDRLEAAGRRITQRVNLFEKVLIPQAERQIKRIQVYLSDQERSAVVRSKIAKQKK